MSAQHQVVFVTGATATGKSDWALKLAREAEASIVNCDSVQVYEGVEIGSSMPSKQERASVPHFLYDFVAPPRELTAGTYREEFFQLLESSAPQRWIVVGGTGFYFQAIEKGMFPVPKVPPELQQKIRQEFSEAGGPERLWKELQKLDPQTATKLHPSDHYRIGRALELSRLGHHRSEVQGRFEAAKFPYPLLKTGLPRPRAQLRERIRERTRRMIEAGLRAETQGFLDRGLAEWAPLSAVGYKETREAILKGRTDEWLLDEIVLRTGQLAKRQETWFKRDQGIELYPEEGFHAFRESLLRFFDRPGTLTLR